MKSTSFRRALVPGIAALALALSACGGDSGAEGADGDLSGTVSIDGSSTVAPLSEAAAELFRAENPNINISVGTSGTGGGFEKFCKGETDISDASRSIKDEEIAICEDAGIAFEELGVANDGLAVAVNPENDWADCLTVDEVSSMWRAEGAVNNWSEVRDGFPDEPIEVFGPGSDSGTFDYFTEAINGEEGSIRKDYNDIGEDDNAAIQGVAGKKGATGYIPLSFINEAGGAVKAVEIENDQGDCVAPGLDTVQDGSYNPLGRQLYVYPSDTALEKPQVLAFLEFYIENQASIAEAAGFIPLNSDQEQEALDKLNSLLGE
ncbi:PstS family phosphate ABC transporter substrate-binding protein [Nocardioides sp.]|uniref:PstS family phosphate ABC transporter substrate-binding protein n=1 Tax=Nocardioides sp. TaxID=35761 RepID=UPI0027360525|nr:PstS family phosphate ABC transporter substrate-binding protein [Nocardioides sp.]MDP3893213.1 PstS family phosphate ABC transporter substrate-binding protein [Nocardioides sp.]